MKIVSASDFHGIFPDIPEVFDQEIDLLLCPGDISNGNTINSQRKSMYNFFEWVDKVNPKQTLITPGNHTFWEWSDLFTYKQEPSNIKCLIDQSFNFNGLIIHGTPWTIPFMNWNYMKDEDRLKFHWENINEYTDILINHGPAHGVCDKILEPVYENSSTEHLGSKTLYNELITREIQYVLTGHIH